MKKVKNDIIDLYLCGMWKQLTAMQFFRGMVWAIILAGMALRISMYIQNRSLFIDEACLSSQLIDRPYSGLFENLKYQYAPPFFACGEKLMTDILGPNEYALRLIPLLAALLSLVLFYRLCRHFIEDQFIVLPLFLFSFGMPILQYATEVKQYSTDVLITLALLLLAIRWPLARLDVKKGVFWALLGVFVVWFSMPGVFILFGVGMYYLLQLYRAKDWSKVRMIIAPIACWLLSFGSYYFLIIREDIGLDKLEDYHARFFLPLLPGSWAEVLQIKNILLSFFQTAIGATAIAIVFGILTSLLAIVHLWRKDFSKVLLFSLPILAAMFSSGLQLYSLIPRLILFFIPILLLWIGIGQAQLWQRISGNWRNLLWLPVLIIMFNQQGYPYFYHKLEIEELRAILRLVNEEQQAGDVAFLQSQGTHAYEFYSTFHEDASQFRIPNIEVEPWRSEPATLNLPPHNRLWLIFSHLELEEMEYYQAFLSKGYKVVEIYDRVGARAVLLRRID